MHPFNRSGDTLNGTAGTNNKLVVAGNDVSNSNNSSIRTARRCHRHHMEKCTH